MLAWFFTTIWHALFGLVVLVGVFGGSVFLIARALVKGVEHDRARCECPECTQIRYKVYDRKWKNEEQLSRGQSRREWLTTRQLEPYMEVASKNGDIYRVKQIVAHDLGVDVHLTNLLTHRLSVVPVSWARVKVPMWKRV